MEQQFLIGKTLGDKIITYLASRPYIETVELINGLQNLVPVPAVQEPAIDQNA